MCKSVYENRHILKFADDTVIVSLLHNNESSHGPVLEDLISWCDLSFLVLNTTKTKDMIMNSWTWTQAPNHDPTVIKGQSVAWIIVLFLAACFNFSLSLVFVSSCHFSVY